MLDVVTLNYCSALGLIQVGVLPRPSPQVYHCMLNQYSRGEGGGGYGATSSSRPGGSAASSSTSSSCRPIPVITPIQIKSAISGRVDVLCDLTNFEDDDE
jgi:hypothetical protein